MNGCRKAQGFTLIELLVVIAVIALLAAIVVPSISSTITTARETRCAVELSSLTKGALFYSIEHDGKLPDITRKGGPNGNQQGQFSYWTTKYWKDWFQEEAGMTRDAFYSASNKKWNRDDFWDYNGGGAWVVTGRFYFGVPRYNDPDMLGKLQNAPSDVFLPLFPEAPETESYYPMLFADLNRQYPSGSGDNWVSPGDPNRWGSNHLYGTNPWPKINHIAHVDGSVHKIPGTEVKYRFTWAGSEIYW